MQAQKQIDQVHIQALPLITSSAKNTIHLVMRIKLVKYFEEYLELHV
jgi:hypothetical protein